MRPGGSTMLVSERYEGHVRELLDNLTALGFDSGHLATSKSVILTGRQPSAARIIAPNMSLRTAFCRRRWGDLGVPSLLDEQALGRAR